MITNVIVALTATAQSNWTALIVQIPESYLPPLNTRMSGSKKDFVTAVTSAVNAAR